MSEDATTSALADLLAINQAIGDHESDADTGYFEALLHERFTMRRPAGALSNKASFIAGLARGAHRVTTISQLELHGQYRAIARTRTDKWDLANPEVVASFDNLRIFVFEDGRWQLISWLTEPV